MDDILGELVERRRYADDAHASRRCPWNSTSLRENARSRAPRDLSSTRDRDIRPYDLSRARVGNLHGARRAIHREQRVFLITNKLSPCIK